MKLIDEARQKYDVETYGPTMAVLCIQKISVNKK